MVPEPGLDRPAVLFIPAAAHGAPGSRSPLALRSIGLQNAVRSTVYGHVLQCADTNSHQSGPLDPGVTARLVPEQEAATLGSLDLSGYLDARTRWQHSSVHPYGGKSLWVEDTVSWPLRKHDACLGHGCDTIPAWLSAALSDNLIQPLVSVPEDTPNVSSEAKREISPDCACHLSHSDYLLLLLDSLAYH